MSVQAIVAGAAAIQALVQATGEIARMIEEHQQGKRELTLDEVTQVTSERRIAEKIYAEVCRATGVNVSVGTGGPSLPVGGSAAAGVGSAAPSDAGPRPPDGE